MKCLQLQIIFSEGEESVWSVLMEKLEWLESLERCRRQWVREGDLIIIGHGIFKIVKPMLNTIFKNSSNLFIKKGVLPEIVDLFGSGKIYKMTLMIVNLE